MEHYYQFFDRAVIEPVLSQTWVKFTECDLAEMETTARWDVQRLLRDAALFTSNLDLLWKSADLQVKTALQRLIISLQKEFGL